MTNEPLDQTSSVETNAEVITPAEQGAGDVEVAEQNPADETASVQADPEAETTSEPAPEAEETQTPEVIQTADQPIDQAHDKPHPLTLAPEKELLSGNFIQEGSNYVVERDVAKVIDGIVAKNPELQTVLTEEKMTSLIKQHPEQCSNDTVKELHGILTFRGKLKGYESLKGHVFLLTATGTPEGYVCGRVLTMKGTPAVTIDIKKNAKLELLPLVEAKKVQSAVKLIRTPQTQMAAAMQKAGVEASADVTSAPQEEPKAEAALEPTRPKVEIVSPVGAAAKRRFFEATSRARKERFIQRLSAEESKARDLMDEASDKEITALQKREAKIPTTIRISALRLSQHLGIDQAQDILDMVNEHVVLGDLELTRWSYEDKFRDASDEEKEQLRSRGYTHFIEQGFRIPDSLFEAMYRVEWPIGTTDFILPSDKVFVVSGVRVYDPPSGDKRYIYVYEPRQTYLNNANREFAVSGLRRDVISLMKPAKGEKGRNGGLLKTRSLNRNVRRGDETEKVRVEVLTRSQLYGLKRNIEGFASLEPAKLEEKRAQIAASIVAESDAAKKQELEAELARTEQEQGMVQETIRDLNKALPIINNAIDFLNVYGFTGLRVDRKNGDFRLTPYGKIVPNNREELAAYIKAEERRAQARERAEITPATQANGFTEAAEEAEIAEVTASKAEKSAALAEEPVVKPEVEAPAAPVETPAAKTVELLAAARAQTEAQRTLFDTFNAIIGHEDFALLSPELQEWFIVNSSNVSSINPSEARERFSQALQDLKAKKT